MIPFKRLQNSAAPIHRLPPEIFTEIFSGLTQYDSEPGILRHLILSTHVCSRWRQIALDAASLWTTFSIHNIAAAEVFMKRSRNRPLSLFLTTSRPTNPFVNLIIPCVHRLRSLCLSIGDHRNMQRILTRVPLGGAALLESLSLTVQDSEDFPDEEQPLDSAPLLGGDLPMLRTLTLVDIFLNIALSKPSAITNLHITCDNVKLNNIIAILGNCPVLETLRCGGFDDFEMEDLPDDHIIALPRLTSLVLTIMNSFQATQLLSHISIPQSCTFEYQTMAEAHENPTHVEGYRTMLPAHADTNLKCFSSICRLELLHTSNLLTLNVRAFHIADVGAEVPPIQLNFYSAHLEMFYGGWPFDATHVETLALGDLHRRTLPEDRWRSMLRSLPALKTLRILSLHSGNAYGLLKTLHSFEQDSPDPGAAQSFAVCPQLSSLELYDVEEFVGMSSRIYELLLARCRHGKLREVDLFNVDSVNASSPWVAKLEECLPELTIRFE